MSLWSKAKKLVTKTAKYLPGIAQALPSSKGLATAAQTLSSVAGVLQGGGAASIGNVIPGVGGPISLPTQKVGAIPMSITSGGGGLPTFPTLPGGGGGGFVKTGLPVAAAIAGGAAVVRAVAPRAIAAGRALLPKVSKKVASALGWATVGGLVVDAAGNVQGAVNRRSMNPMNPRAARRAIRRIKRVRKMLASIERQLPKSKARGCPPRFQKRC